MVIVGDWGKATGCRQRKEMFIFWSVEETEKVRTDSSPVERLVEGGILDPGNFLRLYLNHHEPHTASAQIKSVVISPQVVIS